MHLGIFAKTFPRATLEETLDAIIEHGLWHVQFNLSCVGLPTLPERLDEHHCIWIARSFRQRGMRMAAISGTFNLCDPDTSRLQENLRRLEILAAACRWLDTRIITLCTGTLDPEDMWRWHAGNIRRSTWETLVTSVRQATEIADRHEVTLAFEPEIHNVVNSVSKARKLLDEVDSPWLKVAIDPANLIRPRELPRSREILEEAFDWLGPDIVLAHAKVPQTDEIVAEDSESRERLRAKDLRDFANDVMTSFVLDEMAMRQTRGRRAELNGLFGFYQSYIQWLNQIGYDGSTIIHGLPESDVGDMTSFLTYLLLRSDRTS
jgi:sugar phosphate isomerase/epimerase